MTRDTPWRAVFLLLAMTAVSPAEANGRHDTPGTEPPTKFERLVIRDCMPCLREAYAVAAVAAPPLKPAGFSAQLLGAMARAGEAKFEVLRGARSGRTGEQFAMRVDLFLASGGPTPVLFRLASGLLDEEHLGPLATALAEMIRVAEQPADATGGPDTSELEYHAGSLRVGVLRTRAATVAYLQAGDLDLLRAPSVADGLSALFWQPADLPALADAVNRVLARIRELRGK
jgi:hypothetical protein